VILFTSAVFNSHNVNESISSFDNSTTGSATSFKSNPETEKLNSKNYVMKNLLQDIESGERTAPDIQEELKALVGDSKPISWVSENIKGKYELSQVLIHHKNLESSFELLFLHSLPTSRHAEDLVTHFTGRIYQADSQWVDGGVVISRDLQNLNGKITVDEKRKFNYNFSLVPPTFSNNFGLYTPEGTYSIADFNAINDPAIFDPIEFLKSGNRNDFQLNGESFEVNVSARITDFETLTIEAEVHKADSLTTNTYVLIYEQK
ncbi:MAG: hypothetical protein ABL927_06350, partial [Bdellovibrionales bacterium]